MRPLRLRLKGFTSFRDEQAVDFGGLDLFAITGPTGSGKSSILDAMTFALYGRCERVGDRVRQLVSQGQPWAVVTFEFGVGEQAYRVTRRISSAGAATKILLERQTDGEWRQHGEGADRVREAEAEIVRLVGLDYAGFTRAVLLPQGRFAEFLSGDATERRRILMDLLDLGLFRRIGERARLVAAEAAARAGIEEELLAREYADATPDALAAARVALAEAEVRVGRLDAAREALRDLAARAERSHVEAAAIRALATEARGAAKAATDQAAGFERLAEAVGAADRAAAEQETAASGAQARVAEAETALAAAVGRWGGLVAVTEARALAVGLARDDARRAELAGRLAAAEAALGPLEERAVAADRAAAERRVDEEAARASLEAAERARADAERADLVAAVSHGLAVGDTCPVCDRPLEASPAHAHGPDLQAAAAAVAAARTAVAHAEQAHRGQEDEAARVRASLERGSGVVAQVTGELELLAGHIAAARAGLATAFPDGLPEQPVAALEERVTTLTRLTEARDATLRLAETARRASEEARRAADQRRADVREARAGLRTLLGVAVALTGRAGEVGLAAKVAEGAAPAPAPEPAELSADAAELSAVAGALVPELHALAERAASAAGERDEAERGLVVEARATIAGLVPDAPATDIPGAVRAVEGAARAAERAVATAEGRISDLQERIARRAEHEREAVEARARASLFRALALELQGDRLIAFLEEEALAVLARAGSEHLAALSDSRYRLVVTGDEFMVVDTWNGDEQRSVRTLSGGETFLASLALARALSEQVPSLALGGRERVASLFLDEGFGTLDPDSLELVIAAIDNLGGDGRLVGVVTHVRDLADRLPARIEVEKSPRGSRITVDMGR